MTQKDDIREGILDAAERLMVHYGYQKMTMQDLANEAGIGVGTTYLHFGGKAEVACAVIDRANKRLMIKLQEILESDAPVEERLRSLLLARILHRYHGAREVRHRLDEMIAAIRPAIHGCKMAWMETEGKIFAQILREGKDKNSFSWFGGSGDSVRGNRAEVSPEAAARTLILATNGLMPDKLSPADYEDPERMQAKTEQLVDFLLCALRP
jgi:AcrR family transcriptional regulator